MIYTSFHGFAKAEANVNRTEFGWYSVVKFINEAGQVDVYTTGGANGFQSKVEALMAAFDMVDTLKAAVKKCADAEYTADFEASIKLTSPVKLEIVDHAIKPSLAVELDEEALMAEAMARDGSDGPVADSDDGYKLLPGEEGSEPEQDEELGGVLPGHEPGCDCLACKVERVNEDDDRRVHERQDGVR